VHQHLVICCNTADSETKFHFDLRSGRSCFQNWRRGSRFCLVFFKKRLEQFWAHPAPYSVLTGALSSGVNQPEYEADHSPAYIAGITSATIPPFPLYAFVLYTRTITNLPYPNTKDFYVKFKYLTSSTFDCTLYTLFRGRKTQGNRELFQSTSWRCMAPSILTLDTRWICGQIYTPTSVLPKNNPPYPLN